MEPLKQKILQGHIEPNKTFFVVFKQSILENYKTPN